MSARRKTMETWVEGALAEVRQRGARRSVGLLEAVREEVEFEAEVKGLSRQVRRLICCERSGPSGGRLRTVIEGSPLATSILARDGTSLLSNDAWDELWGPARDGDSPDTIYEDERVRAAGLLPYIEECLSGVPVIAPPLLYDPAGPSADRRWLRALVYPVASSDGQAGEVALIIEDITERKRLEERLARRTFRDDLTGLADRNLLLELLKRALDRGERSPNSRERVALLVVDLDDFERVNYSFGREVASALLVEAARRLEGATRSADTVARLGGGEFAVLLERVSGEDEAAEVAGRIARRLREPFNLPERALRTSAGVGVAVSSFPDDPETLLRRAAGRDRYRTFNPAQERLFDEEPPASG